MRIFNFVRALANRLRRRDLSAALETLRKELAVQTLPPFAEVSAMLMNWAFKDKWLKELDTLYQRRISGRPRGNFIVAHYEFLKSLGESIGTLERAVDKSFDNDIIRSALTYQRTQILALVEAAAFVIDYSRLLLIHTLNVETQFQRNVSRVDHVLTKAQLERLEADRDKFIYITNVFWKHRKELQKLIDDIPDIEVDADNGSAVVSSVGLTKLDPTGIGAQGFIPVVMPALALAFAEWQLNRHNKAKEELRMLEYQLLDLKNALGDREDPKLQRAIEYTQDRITKLSRKVQQFEEEVNG